VGGGDGEFFGDRVESYLPLFAYLLHLTPADVDALTEDRFELFTAWIDRHQAQLQAQQAAQE
jgi:hypothetical protein